jgi:dihydrofolate reductase
MKKLVAAINMTLDGNYDHTAVDPDEEIHNHYAELLQGAGAILYGRVTYELMKFWQTLIENPSGERSMDDFAMVMDRVPKIVFSHTITPTDPMITGWKSAELSALSLEEKALQLKHSEDGEGKDIFVGSRSLIIQLLNLNLIDELQICVHPVIVGGDLSLFENVSKRISLNLVQTKTFAGGAVILYYQPPVVEE